MDDPFDELAGALNKRDQWLNEGGPPEVQAQKQQEDQKAEALPAVQSLRLEMAKRDSTVGKVQWTDESVPLQQRIGDFVQTHAVAEAQRKDKPDYDAKDWERIAGQAQQFFPGVDAEKLKQPFLEGRQQAWIGQGLAAAKEKYQGFEEPGRMTLLREGLPFATTGWNFWEKSQYADAKQRLAKGEYNPGDFARVAHFEKLQENKQNESLGKSALRTALNVGTFAGEAWAGGAALKGVGILPTIRMGGAAVAETPTLAARLIGKTALTRTAAQTALMPSMWLPQSVDQAMQKGGNWSDIKNLGPAYGMGMMQVGLLGAASKAGGSETAAKLVPGIAEGGVKGWATRLVTGTGVAMSGQAGIDVTNGLLTSQFPVWGHKGYGTAVELAEGKEGAPKAMLMQLLTFALFNVGHAHNNPLGEARAADLADSKAMMDLGAAFVGRLKKAGYGEDAAYGEAIKAQKVLNDQIHGKDVTGAKASLSKMAQQYVDSLGERMKVDQLAAEQKAADMAARNPNVGQFRGQFGTAEPTAAPEGPVNAPGEAPAAKGQPATEAAKAPEPTPGTPESFAQRLASGKDTVADVFRDFHEQGGKPEGWTAIEGRAAELNPEYGAPKVPMSKTVPGVGRTVKPIPEAPESVFHITDYKTPSKSVGTAIDILARKGSAPRPLEVWDAGKGKGGREGFDANFKSSHVAFEFDTGKHTGEMIRGEAGKPQGRFTSTDPLRYNPGLKAIHYKGSEADPAFARLKAEVDDINADRADGKLMREYGHKEALDPVELKATEQVSKPAGPTAEPTPEAPVPRTPEPLTQAKFDAVFNRLNKGDNYVSVADIRDALPDTSKAEVDAMLLNLRKERQYTLKRSGVDQVQPRVLEAAIREDGDALTHVGRLPTASAAKEAPPRPHMNDVPMHIQEVLDRADLTPREKAVLEGRAQGNTHGELAPEFKVSRQAVSQIEQGAMAKLGLEHKSMAEWLKAGVDEAPKGVASFDPEVLNRIAKETSDVPDDSLEDHLREEFPETYKAVDDFDAATKALTQEVKDATDQFVRESGSNDPEALRRQIESAVQEVIEGTRPPDTSAGTEGATAQGNAEPAAAAPAAGREAAGRELIFRSVATAVQRYGGLDPKSFAETFGNEVTSELMKEFPMLFKGRNLRRGTNKVYELAQQLHRDGVINIPEGKDVPQALFDVIKGRALDLSQNLDAKYQAEAEAYDRAQSEVKKAGFSAKAVAEAGRLGEELAADEESQHQAEADRLSEADEAAAAQRPGATDFDPSTFGRPLTPGERATGGIGGGQENEGPSGGQRPRETALKNEHIDAERVKDGKPPILKAAARANPEVWQKAMDILDADPQAAERMVAERIRKPRESVREETALLLQREVALKNEYERAAREAIQLHQQKADPAKIAIAEARLDAIDKMLDQTEKVARTEGSEAGWVLQFRRQLAKEDFSLTALARREAVLRGRDLTPEERSQVAELSEKIADLQKKLDLAESIPRGEPAVEKSLYGKAVDWLSSWFKPRPEPTQFGVKKSAGWEFADRMEKAAVAELSQKLGLGKGETLFSGFDPTIILPLAKYTAAKIIKTGYTFAEFSKAIVGRFGEEVKPHVSEIWDKAQEFAKAAETDVRDTRISLKDAKAEATTRLEKIKLQNQTVAQKIFRNIGEALNFSRTLITSWDLSAVLRQGGMSSFAHPLLSLRAIPESLRAFGSRYGASRAADALASRPNAPWYKRSGLYIADAEGPLSGQEEAYIGRWVKRVPLVAGSERAYTTFLNRIRADVFDSMAGSLGEEGRVTDAQAKVIANFVNVSTGRGGLGAFEKAAVPLATVFFSPRFLASRFQILAGQPLWRGDTTTRVAIAKEYARAAIGLAVFYGMAKLALRDEAEITFDARSTDFGKVKIGNTRIDPLAGLSQASVLLTRLATGEKKSGKGEVVPIRGPNVPYKGDTAWDLMTRFGRSKLAPVPGAAVNIVSGQNAMGEPTTAKSTAGNLLVPMSIRDVIEAMQDQGVPRGTAIGILNVFGMGSQVYEPKTPKYDPATGARMGTAPVKLGGRRR